MICWRGLLCGYHGLLPLLFRVALLLSTLSTAYQLAGAAHLHLAAVLHGRLSPLVYSVDGLVPSFTFCLGSGL